MRPTHKYPTHVTFGRRVARVDWPKQSLIHLNPNPLFNLISPTFQLPHPYPKYLIPSITSSSLSIHLLFSKISPNPLKPYPRKSNQSSQKFIHHDVESSSPPEPKQKKKRTLRKIGASKKGSSSRTSVPRGGASSRQPQPEVQAPPPAAAGNIFSSEIAYNRFRQIHSFYFNQEQAFDNGMKSVPEIYRELNRRKWVFFVTPRTKLPLKRDFKNF
ncbi:hypothetical protein A2U01_0028448 [Trifolium medium]|uniref:Uncharacterized protein n=1 Tax=Trifolium medium TaxID=97028 RepID=A0A392P5N7_9FABA|nr:hypothetical protein [Trifolium medium]